MMQTPTERWRLIIIASVLLHLLVVFTMTIDLSSPVKKPTHRDIKLILQTTTPVKIQKNTPAPSLAMTAAPSKIVQTVKPKPVSSVVPKTPAKPVIKTLPIKPKPSVAKNRYIKAPPVKPAQVAKAPRVPSVPHTPPVAQQTPVSTIPDDLSNVPSVGMTVVAAQPVTPKPTPFVPKPQPVKPEPPKIAKATPLPAKPKPTTVVKPTPPPVKPTPVQQPTDLEEVKAHDVDVERVESQPVATNTDSSPNLEEIEAKAPQLEEIQDHRVAVEKVETTQHETVETQKELEVANVELADVQPSQVHTEQVYPTIIQNLLEFLNAFVPLTEIVPQHSEPVETVKQTPVTAPEPVQREVMIERNTETSTDNTIERNVGNEEKISDQYLSNDWQRATKQSVADSTAKQLSNTEKDEKLARIRFSEHKDYGDIPDVAPDKLTKDKSKKGKNADLGFNVGDCFIGYKNDKADKAQKSSIDCEF